jgi:hypothetical protein
MAGDDPFSQNQLAVNSIAISGWRQLSFERRNSCCQQYFSLR